MRCESRNPRTDTAYWRQRFLFSVLRAESAKSVSPDKQRLLAKKEDLEAKIDRLKYQKAAMPEQEYKQQLTFCFWSWRVRKRRLTGEISSSGQCAPQSFYPPCRRLQVEYQDCREFEHRGQVSQATACFERLTRASDSLVRAEGFLGLKDYDSSNNEFRAAFKEHPKSAEVRFEWGELYREHYQPGDAAKLFEEAVELDPNYAPAYLGLARVAGLAYDKKAPDLANEALQHDPKLYEAHELLAYLALEDNNEKQAAGEAQKALAISDEALDAMAVLASIDWLSGKPQTDWMDRILKVNPVYGQAYATGAHFFTINRRYQQAIEYDRKALTLKPDLWDARSELGLNLMRLGHTDEAKQQLQQCFEAHWRDAQTTNALKLLDTLGQYQTFQSSTTELMLNKKEAALLRPYIEPELERAVATYERKYKMKLPGKVRLEVYPNHDDFVVRTLGLPGQGGLLGVTFGMVVAMDSPSARPPGRFQLGEHHVARTEPRVYTDRDQSPGATLVY